jgi:hypothetical protein
MRSGIARGASAAEVEQRVRGRRTRALSARQLAARRSATRKGNGASSQHSTACCDSRGLGRRRVLRRGGVVVEVTPRRRRLICSGCGRGGPPHHPRPPPNSLAPPRPRRPALLRGVRAAPPSLSGLRGALRGVSWARVGASHTATLRTTRLMRVGWPHGGEDRRAGRRRSP